MNLEYGYKMRGTQEIENNQKIRDLEIMIDVKIVFDSENRFRRIDHLCVNV